MGLSIKNSFEGVFLILILPWVMNVVVERWGQKEGIN